MAELSKIHRELISRAAMAVLAIALLYGGYRCIATAVEWNQEAREREQRVPRGTRRTSGTLLPFMLGGLLLLGGGVFGLMAVVPADTFARVMGPPDLRHYDH